MASILRIARLLPFLGVYASPTTARQDDKPPLFLLAGDSTTAVAGGWGDGFLENTLAFPAAGINFGHSGRSTPHKSACPQH